MSLVLGVTLRARSRGMLKKGERCPEGWGFVRHMIEAKQKPQRERRYEHTNHNVGIPAVISRYALGQEFVSGGTAERNESMECLVRSTSRTRKDQVRPATGG